MGKPILTRIHSRRWLSAIGASLTLAATAVVVFVLILPATASGRSNFTCTPGSKVPSIFGFTPNHAKAGSSNEVALSLSNAYYVYYYGNVYVGPKGDRTVASSMSRSGDVITFTVAPGTHSGPVSVDYCEVTVWSKKQLRVG